MLPDLSSLSGPLPLLPVAAALLLVGGSALIWLMVPGGGRGEVRRRLRIEAEAATERPTKQTARGSAAVMRERAARQAHEFYAKADPENVARLRMRLIQAGYMDPGAVGLFFLVRFAALFAAGLLALLMGQAYGSGSSETNRWIFTGVAAIVGYFLPSFALSRRIKSRMMEYRNGFPDFMDLMIVCSDAGLSMEAGIERVSKELAETYPSLSRNLQLVSIELRAGRSLDGALKSLADRLSLDEVRSFATLLQQSKELGTSLSGALRVFSDEMRHKRMSLAEEKAHALPAKMSVPVTVCILPVVLMVAIIPIIVKLSAME
jgi:tight adherence protein C